MNTDAIKVAAIRAVKKGSGRTRGTKVANWFYC